ncbi:unnamed protein product [Arctia plantaginis]|uniref:Major facilitator superfamily (MFS) profile domain-containing protein n=1 Tax=Arctia plantaginis TaxID=874455 RepID=A0A8S0YRT8_ARCPL|nr:unnamed protein product [Arctia plantaginis]
MGNKNLNLDVDTCVKEKLNEIEKHDGDILDSVLNHVGDLGRYQKLLFIAMLPLGFTYAFAYFVQLFIAVTPQNHWCRVPELANLSMELRRNLSAPGAITGKWDHCMTFDTNWTQVLDTLKPPAVGTPMVPCQHGWEFEFNDIPYETVTSEREWVCDNAKNVPTAASMFFVGSVVGGVIFGWMADRFGRVPAVIVLEYVGPQYRTLVANLILALSFGVASVAMPWMAYFIADWRILVWVTSLPMFLVLLAPWVIPESIRWLMSRGRINEAIAILEKFERINGTKIPEHVMDEFVIVSNKGKMEEKQNFFCIFKSPPLRKAMFSLMILFMGGALVFDGLVRLSDSFGMNFFVVFTFIEVSELISILVVAVILDRFGRRKVCVGPMYASSVFLLVALFLPKGVPQTVIEIAARFFTNTCFTCVMQWTTEILPTPFRATGCSILHMCAFISTVFTPFIVYSGRYWSMLPILIFTLMTFLTASVGLTLPETRGLPMPQTIADGEKNIREQSLCGKPERDDLDV